MGEPQRQNWVANNARSPSISCNLPFGAAHSCILVGTSSMSPITKFCFLIFGLLPVFHYQFPVPCVICPHYKVPTVMYVAVDTLMLSCTDRT